MTQLSIQDGILQLLNAELANSSGAFIHTGDYTINGTLTVDAINVKNQSTDTPSGAGDWIVKTEPELNGKGFSWTWGTGNLKLGYRTGGRLWTSGDMDLDSGKTFKIDNITVLSSRELGPQIRKSNLTQIGDLDQLVVNGTAEIAGFAYFSDVHSRLGINTANPNGNISIVDNNIELVLNIPTQTSGQVGTYSNHHFGIVTDNIERILVKNTGEVVIGDENFNNGSLRINGTLFATNVVTDTRIERSSSLEFKANTGDHTYGKGIIWYEGNGSKQLVLKNGPDRIYSTEHLDLASDKSYYANGSLVINETSLGPTVVKSNLSQVGILQSLKVAGSAEISELTSPSITADVLTVKTFNTGNVFTVTTGDQVGATISNSEIVIGNNINTRRPVKVFGPLSVGINNPTNDVDLAVKGNISFADKKFVTGTGAPTSGSFVKGDICWNNNPGPNSYIGWVCVIEGTPGQWLPFGLISN